MKFLVTFTLVDSFGYRRTALILADSKGQAHRLLIQHLDIVDLEDIVKIEFQRMDSVTTMVKTHPPYVLAVL